MMISLERDTRRNLKPTVFVVDDDARVRDSLELLIREEGWRPKTFASAEAFLAHPSGDSPGCLLLETALPDCDGLDVQSSVAVELPHVPVIFISGHGDVRRTVRAMKAGAFEFLIKPFSDDVLLNAIRGAIERSRIALDHENEMRLTRRRYASLTKREREVMALVVAGLQNKAVAEDLAISIITVKAHRAKVMRKMMAASLPELVKIDARLRSDPGPPAPVVGPWKCGLDGCILYGRC